MTSETRALGRRSRVGERRRLAARPAACSSDGFDAGVEGEEVAAEETAEPTATAEPSPTATPAVERVQILSGTVTELGDRRDLTFTVDDGTDTGFDSRVIEISAENDPPSVTTTLAAINYTPADGAVAIDPGLTLVDVDDSIPGDPGHRTTRGQNHPFAGDGLPGDFTEK